MNVRSRTMRDVIPGAVAAAVLGLGGLWGSARTSSAASDGDAPPPVAATPAYKNLALPFAQRAADLISRMTLEEKAEQVQETVDENDRLGLPACNWWSEALHGVGRSGYATIYPESTGLGATWDPPLIKKVASAIADEARAKFDPGGARYRGLMLWCPTINMARDPRWGRVEETYGEDPWLTARIAVAYVQGLQGDDPKYLKTVATPKHLAMYSQESGRMNHNYDVPETVLRDYYFPAFEACFVEGKAASTMMAHNGINGVPATANRWLMTDVLRGEWKFDGAVVSDWSAVSQLINAHRYVNNDEEAVAAAINAGLDVICDPHPKTYAVVRAVQNNMLSKEALDKALMHNLMVRYRLGMFDPPEKVPYAKPPPGVVGSKEHVALALQTARECITLMKNDAAPKGSGFEKLLPLDLRRIDSIAVLGPYARQRQFGAYSAPFPAQPSPTIYDALKDAAGDRVQVTTVDWNDQQNSIAAAEKSTLVVLVVGLNNMIEREGTDRQTLDLPPDQMNFIQKIVKANPLTVVVLEGGGQIGTTWLDNNVPAILNVWYPGEQGGVATAEVLLGQCNPSGRLPMTYYRSTQDLPAMDDYDITHGRTYMYFQKPVSYAFGHGLSYTTFTYANLKLPQNVAADGTAKISVDVTNSGAMDGDEVVQLYVHQKQSDQPRPIEQLKGFQRISLKKGETQTVQLDLPAKNLGMWNVIAHKYVVDPGAYEVRVGASSADIRQKGEIAVK